MNIVANDPVWSEDIITMPMIQHFPDLGEITEFKEKQVVLSHDHKRLFSVISDRAIVVPHTDAVEMINNAIEQAYGEPPKEINIVSMKRGAQIKTRFELPQEPVISLTGGDDTTLQVLMFNSYDRALPFKLRVGAYRLICSNGSVVGDDIASIKGKDILADWSPTGLSNKIADMVKAAQSVTKIWERWREIQIPYHTAMSAIETRLPRKLTKRYAEDHFPMTLWDLYNDLTAFASHESPSDRAQVSFDQSISQIFYSERSPIHSLYSKAA